MHGSMVCPPGRGHRDLEFRPGTSYWQARERFDLPDTAIIEWEPAPTLGSLIQRHEKNYSRVGGGLGHGPTGSARFAGIGE
jgi:hypothetical protein